MTDLDDFRNHLASFFDQYGPKYNSSDTLANLAVSAISELYPNGWQIVEPIKVDPLTPWTTNTIELHSSFGGDGIEDGLKRIEVLGGFMTRSTIPVATAKEIRYRGCDFVALAWADGVTLESDDADWPLEITLGGSLSDALAGLRDLDLYVDAIRQARDA